MTGIGIETGRPLGLGGLNLTAGAAAGPRPAEEGAGGSFAEALKGALGQMNTALQEGDAAATRLATGEASNLHEVVLATERANLALQFTMAIRNKLLEAYNELMRMPV
jgi:flagellar hook-basal body complex protein FliE